jgi:hypothetical protein
LNFKPKTIEEGQITDDFKRLCNQDGVEIHDLMIEAIQLVFRVHHWPPGNPQLTLVNYKQGKLLSLGKCGFANCMFKAVAVGVFLPKEKEYKLCMKHFKQAQNDSKNWQIKDVSSLTAKRMEISK